MLCIDINTGIGAALVKTTPDHASIFDKLIQQLVVP